MRCWVYLNFRHLEDNKTVLEVFVLLFPAPYAFLSDYNFVNSLPAVLEVFNVDHFCPNKLTSSVCLTETD